MIIEPAMHLAMMRLIDRKDCSNMHEEHFSYVLASSCEDTLKEFQDLSSSNQVAVELPYFIGGNNRCDVFVDISSLRFANEAYQHQIYCECKYFRKGSANQGARYNRGAVWEDFCKVADLGKSLAYAAILCENEWDQLILANPASVLCFSTKSPSSFILYNDAAAKTPEDKMSVTGPGIEYKIIREFTEAFELKFGEEKRLFRIYLFRLWVEGKNSDEFQFKLLR